MNARLLQLTGACAAFALAVALYLQLGPPRFTGAVNVRGMRSPVLALELAHSVGEVREIVGDVPSENREAMARKQYFDFVFMAAYTAVFLCVSALLAAGGWIWLAAGSGILALATPVLDVVENLAILRLMDTPLALTTPAMVDAVREPSELKWLCAFLAMAAQSLFLLRSAGRVTKLAGILFLAAAVLGLAGLAYNAIFEFSLLPMLGGLAALAFAGIRAQKV